MNAICKIYVKIAFRATISCLDAKRIRFYRSGWRKTAIVDTPIWTSGKQWDLSSAENSHYQAE